MLQTAGRLTDKARQSGDTGSSLGASENTVAGRAGVAAVKLAAVDSGASPPGSPTSTEDKALALFKRKFLAKNEKHVLDLKRTTKRLLKYVVKTCGRQSPI